jgi:hypothetical protein
MGNRKRLRKTIAAASQCSSPSSNASHAARRCCLHEAERGRRKQREDRAERRERRRVKGKHAPGRLSNRNVVRSNPSLALASAWIASRLSRITAICEAGYRDACRRRPVTRRDSMRFAWRRSEHHGVAMRVIHAPLTCGFPKVRAPPDSSARRDPSISQARAAPHRSAQRPRNWRRAHARSPRERLRRA